MKRLEIDVLTGKQTVVDLTEEEIAEIQAKQQAERDRIEAMELEMQKQASDRQSAITKLMALGLTEDEAIALAK